MIEAKNLSKRFEDFTALDSISCTLDEGMIYGLVGSNGAGKSTLIRALTGVYRPDGGEVTLDGAAIFDNPEAKRRIAYVPDELFFLPNASMHRMSLLYESYFPHFSRERYRELAARFDLDVKKPVNTFSKGMRRQAATVLALSAMPKYLFFDETFDGLDPVMRNLVKQVIYNDVIERNTTTIITSHSLRELEDTCDQLALLYQGGVVFESDIQDLKTSLFKIQVAFDSMFDKTKFDGINILNYEQMGSVATFIVKGSREDVVASIRGMNPLLLDVLPLNLEEVFIYEMEALGYAFKDILM